MMIEEHPLSSPSYRGGILKDKVTYLSLYNKEHMGAIKKLIEYINVQ